MEAISASGLCKRYGDVVALRDVSFTVSRGEVIGLLGPNGAGKTTLMKILTGYLQPDEGEARVGGIDVVDNPLGVQQRIGYLPENAPLYGEMAVQEYLLMIASLRGIEESRRVRLISEAVYATGLAEYLTRPIQTLSKGYRQRVGIAQAILHRPDLLILDEPTTGLDPNQIVEIRDLIRELSEHSTVILSTHILSEVEMSCERVLIVMRGEVRADSRLADLRADSAAVVAVEAGAKAVEHALREIDGVQRVERIDQDGNYVRWRVAGSHKELCPAIYEVVRRREWGISELRPDSRTLESVFRSLAEQVEAGIVRDAGAAAGHERAGAAQQAGAPGAAVS